MTEPQPNTLPLICDFCSAPNPIAQYQTHAFGVTTSDDVFPDAPVHVFDDVPYVALDEIHPVRGTGHMVDPTWLACGPCDSFIAHHNIEGLITHCFANFRIKANLSDEIDDTDLLQFCRSWYTAFFQQRVGPRDTFPPTQP